MLGIIRKWRYNFIFIYTIFFLLAVILSNQARYPYISQNHIRKIVEDNIFSKKDNPLGMNIEGVLYNTPEGFLDKTRLYINAEKFFTPPPTGGLKGGDSGVIHVTGRILLTVGSLSVKVKYGDRIRFIAKLRTPRNFGNPGEFDYAGSLVREGIYVTGYIKDGLWIAVLGREQKWGLRTALCRVLSAIEQIRDEIRGFIDNSGAENTAIIKALILGEQGEIPTHIRNNFNITGTTHILAISGLNIGIVAFAAYWIILRLLKLSERLMLAIDIKKAAALSSIIPVLLYGAIAGLSISTQRSVIMVLIFIIAVVVDREKVFYNTLAAAAFIILIIAPLSIYDISFQLSFIAVFAIIYLVPKFQLLWKNMDGSKHYIKDYLLNPLAVSIAASICTAPFIMYYFNRISIIGSLANLIVVPLMGFVVVCIGLISSLMSFFYLPIANMLINISDVILLFSIWTINLFANLPYSSILITTPTIIEAVLFYLLLFCIVEFNRAKIFKYTLVLSILIIIGDHLFWYYHINYNPNLKVTFISVGQGDAALIEFPYGKRMLIDGGGFYKDDFDVGEKIIAPFLYKNKINKIDYIVLSHPQTDHLKGLIFIADRFNVKEFRWNGDIGKDRAYIELSEIIKRHGIKQIITNGSTMPLDINGVRVEFLSPLKDKHLDINNNSLVMRLDYKKMSFLFTGDIAESCENLLLKGGRKIKTTILKVPHHGSRTSSTIDFLKTVNPDIAVVSAGYLNPFNLPHPDILKRFSDLNIPILRTDIMGAITIETDGRNGWIFYGNSSTSNTSSIKGINSPFVVSSVNFSTL